MFGDQVLLTNNAKLATAQNENLVSTSPERENQQHFTKYSVLVPVQCQFCSTRNFSKVCDYTHSPKK
jgi:hypothetical protein